MNISYFLPLTLTVALLSGCADMPAYAPIDDRTIPAQEKVSLQRPAVNEAPVVVDPPGYYTVKKGDTLLRISQQFNQRLRDLVEWNALTNPNDIKAGQQMRIQRPEGAQVAMVPMESGMEMRSLSEQPARSSARQGDKPADIAAQSAPASGAALAVKTGPMGVKRPYSEQALAELQGQGQAQASPTRAADPVNKPAELPSPAFNVRFNWPTDGKLINEFDSSRKGIDIAGQSGQPVLSASDGKVLYAKGMRGYGNLVIIEHGEDLVSAYGHNKTIFVKEGQTVTKGQRIAEMGDSDSDTVKLHFEIRHMGKALDPIKLLPPR